MADAEANASLICLDDISDIIDGVVVVVWVVLDVADTAVEEVVADGNVVDVIGRCCEEDCRAGTAGVRGAEDLFT